jgi:hypothetical protein
MTIKNGAGGKIMINPNEINQIVQGILAAMSMKEKADIASLDEKDILHFHDLFDACFMDQLGQNDEVGKDVMHRIWEVLQGTHRIRCVK